MDNGLVKLVLIDGYADVWDLFQASKDIDGNAHIKVVGNSLQLWVDFVYRVDATTIANVRDALSSHGIETREPIT